MQKGKKVGQIIKDYEKNGAIWIKMRIDDKKVIKALRGRKCKKIKK